MRRTNILISFPQRSPQWVRRLQGRGGQRGDGPGGLPFPPAVPLSLVPTTLCIPGHLTRHQPTLARSASRSAPTHAHGAESQTAALLLHHFFQLFFMVFVFF